MDPLILRRGMSLTDSLEDYPSGIIVPLDKPWRWTSADVIRKVKWAACKHFSNKKLKVGHAGTLDPLATGVLLVCIGKATKLADELQRHEKEYLAGVVFGATTPSYDLEKDYDAFYPFGHINAAGIEDILPSFLGEQDQAPPVFSAKMVNGVRAYEFARAGEAVELKSSRINISKLELTGFTEALQSPSGRPRAEITVGCSKGTYIRSLARDIGAALGSGAFLTALCRTRLGHVRIEDCQTFDSFPQWLDEAVKAS